MFSYPKQTFFIICYAHCFTNYMIYLFCCPGNNDSGGKEYMSQFFLYFLLLLLMWMFESAYLDFD